MTPSVLSIRDPPGEVLTQIADAQLISRVVQDLNHYQERTVCAQEPNIVDWGRNGRVTDCCDVDSGSGDSVACRPRWEETSSVTGDSSVEKGSSDALQRFTLMGSGETDGNGVTKLGLVNARGGVSHNEIWRPKNVVIGRRQEAIKRRQHAYVTHNSWTGHNSCQSSLESWRGWKCCDWASSTINGFFDVFHLSGAHQAYCTNR